MTHRKQSKPRYGPAARDIKGDLAGRGGFFDAKIRRVALSLVVVGCGGDDGSSNADGGGTAGTAADGSGSVDESDGADASANAAPEAADDTLFATQDADLSLVAADGLFSNDADPDGDALSLAEAPQATAQGGVLSVSSDGGLTYAPPPGYWGPDAFEYTVQDEQGQTSAAAVEIHVGPARIPLADVAAGIGGFVVHGAGLTNRLGHSVSGAGDVDGDGLADVIIGAPGDPQVFDTGHGVIVFGKADTDPVAQDALGSRGFLIAGETLGDYAGRSVSGAGDVNGDGLSDLIIGAGWNSPAIAANAGRSYVVWGKGDGATVDLGEFGDQGFAIDGESQLDRSGWTVSGAGDVNGDGMADVLVGAPLANPEGNIVGGDYGIGYVVFGKADSDTVDLEEQGDGGFEIRGVGMDDRVGTGVGAAGDINGDGLADLVLGAPFAGTELQHSGFGYVVFGKADPSPVQLSLMDGFRMRGHQRSNTGMVVGGAGDVNGDGVDDVILGAPGVSDDERGSGRAYVVFGSADASFVDLREAGDWGFVIDGAVAFDSTGTGVAIAGDVNGDGMADLLVGAPSVDSEEPGGAYLVYGKSDTAAVDLSALGAGGYSLVGESGGDQAGHSVAGAGDVNGDGLADIVIGADLVDGRESDVGRAYVVFGVRAGV